MTMNNVGIPVSSIGSSIVSSTAAASDGPASSPVQSNGVFFRSLAAPHQILTTLRLNRNRRPSRRLPTTRRMQQARRVRPSLRRRPARRRAPAISKRPPTTRQRLLPIRPTPSRPTRRRLNRAPISQLRPSGSDQFRPDSDRPQLANGQRRHEFVSSPAGVVALLADASKFAEEIACSTAAGGTVDFLRRFHDGHALVSRERSLSSRLVTGGDEIPGERADAAKLVGRDRLELRFDRFHRCGNDNRHRESRGRFRRDHAAFRRDHASFRRADAAKSCGCSNGHAGIHESPSERHRRRASTPRSPPRPRQDRPTKPMTRQSASRRQVPCQPTRRRPCQTAPPLLLPDRAKGRVPPINPRRRLRPLPTRRRSASIPTSRSLRRQLPRLKQPKQPKQPTQPPPRPATRCSELRNSSIASPTVCVRVSTTAASFACS